MEAMVKYPLKLVNGTATLRRMPVAENRTVGQVYRQSESGGQGGEAPCSNLSSRLLYSLIDEQTVHLPLAASGLLCSLTTRHVQR